VIRAFGHGPRRARARGRGADADWLARCRSALETAATSPPPPARRSSRAGLGGAPAQQRRLCARAAADPRYAAGAHRALPRKIGRHLELFDCINCEKCVPVCPRRQLLLRPRALPGRDRPRAARGRALARRDGAPRDPRDAQIGNFADFCNDCGNCDVFCPEDGGPYLISRASSQRGGLGGRPPARRLPLERRSDGFVAHARFAAATTGWSSKVVTSVIWGRIPPRFRGVGSAGHAHRRVGGRGRSDYARLMALVGRALLARPPSTTPVVSSWEPSGRSPRLFG